MSRKQQGASADADRATHERSRVAPSPPTVGIPSALFLLWASQGEYSDRSEWAVALYTNKAAAEHDAKIGEALHREIRNSSYDYDERERRLKETVEGSQLRQIMGQEEVSLYDDLTLYCCSVEIRTAAAIEGAA